MLILIAYALAFLIFAAIDATWLSSVGAKLYRETLGDILDPNIRFGPAIAFYLLYPIGLVIFAVHPALKTGSPGSAIVSGALFGFFAYATYDLSNFATLRNWTLGITLIDLAYGAIASAIVAGLVSVLAPMVARWFGG